MSVPGDDVMCATILAIAALLFFPGRKFSVLFPFLSIQISFPGSGVPNPPIELV